MNVINNFPFIAHNEVMLINSLIDKYSKTNENDNYELEFRFGTFNKNKFKPQISEKVYNNIIYFIESQASSELIYKIQEVKNVDENGTIKINKLKNQIKNIKDFKNSDIEYTIFSGKEKLSCLDIQEYGIRVCLSKETKKAKNTKFGKSEYSIFRDKIRFLYNNIYIDLVKAVDSLENVEYSCELEIKNTNIYSKNIYLLIYEILKIIQESEILISKTEKEQVLEEYKSIVNSKKFVGTQPHTLKLDKIKKEESYALTYKLDGQRALLFVDSKCQGYYITTSFNVIKTDLLFWEDLQGTILDGEIYEDCYYIFDMLYCKGQRIENKELNIRIDCIKLILDMNYFNNDEFKKKIQLKEYFFYDSIYEGLNNLIKKIDIKKYDGVILAPIKNQQNPTLKWKPTEMNTMDFRVKVLNENKAILLCVTKNGEDIYEYEKKGIEIQGILKDKKEISKLKNGLIYEFTYDKDNEIFTKIRERRDKTKPNYIEVIHDNLESILYPLNIELIKRNEEKFFNLKRFHNWVKRNYIEKYASHKNCIDIGCGRGGDIQKWFDYKIKYMEAYDINEESISEAISRYEQYTKSNIYKTNYNYQFFIKDLKSNSLEIPESMKDEESAENIQVITAFFCMHYFMEDFKTFISNLKPRLNKDLLFICSFQEKTQIEELIKQSEKKEEYTITKTNENKIRISMKDTIVDQPREEHILTSEEIINLFKSEKFQLLEEKHFKELYPKWTKSNNSMQEYELDISFLNKMFVFKYTN